MIFDNFDAIAAGSDIGKRPLEEQKRDYLHCKQEWCEERKGDYLGAKIPSLLEFLENKIHLKEVLGVSQIDKTEAAPKSKPHYKPPGVRQEEKLVNLMMQKDSHHTNVVFESDLDPLDASKRAPSPRKVA